MCSIAARYFEVNGNRNPVSCNIQPTDNVRMITEIQHSGNEPGNLYIAVFTLHNSITGTYVDYVSDVFMAVRDPPYISVVGSPFLPKPIAAGTYDIPGIGMYIPPVGPGTLVCLG